VKLKARQQPQPTCPFCLDDLEGKLRRCTDCAAEVHKECAEEFGKKCPTIACRGKLRKLKHSDPASAELKIHIGGRKKLPTQLQAGMSRFAILVGLEEEAHRERLRERREGVARQRLEASRNALVERDRRDRDLAESEDLNESWLQVEDQDGWFWVGYYLPPIAIGLALFLAVGAIVLAVR